MNFNLSALALKKITAKMNKEEVFAFGVLLGIENATEALIFMFNENESLNDAKEHTKVIMNYDNLQDIWIKMGVEMEMDLRTFEELEIFQTRI